MSAFLDMSIVDRELRQALASFEGGDDVFETRQYKQTCELLSHLPLDTFHKVLNGAVFYSELAKKNVGEVTIANVIDVIARHDIDAIKKYDEAVTMVQGMNLSERAKKKLLTQIYAHIEPHVLEEDEKFLELSDEFVQKTQKVASTFSTISQGVKSELVSAIYSNCIDRMKNFWMRVEPTKFKSVVDVLMSELDESNFSEEELIDLSSRCATIFCESNRDKILGIEKVLSEYKDYILEMVKDQVTVSKDVIEKFQSLNYGHILRRAGSIAKANPEQAEEVSKLLRGQKIGEIFAQNIKNNERNSSLFEEFGDASIDLSVQDMIWVMHKNPSIFGTTVESNLVTLKHVKNAILDVYGAKAESIDFSQMLTRDNFLKGIPRLVRGEDIHKTIDLLSCVLKPEDLTEYLSHDMRILNVPFEPLSKMITQAIVSASNANEIPVRVNKVLEDAVKMERDARQRDADAEAAGVSQSVNERSITSNLPNINVEFDDKKFEELAINLDFSKLKKYLGSYFDDFVKKYQTVGFDSKKVSDIVERSKGVVGERRTGGLHLGSTDIIDKLTVHNQRLRSAIHLFKKLIANPAICDERKQMFMTTTDYFKLATATDHVIGYADQATFERLDYARSLKYDIEKSFEELTRLYSEIIKKDVPYLNAYIERLEREKADIEKRIENNLYVDLLGDVSGIHYERTRVNEDLMHLEKRKETLVSRYESLMREAIEKKQELESERRTPTTEQAGKVVERGDEFVWYGFGDETEQELALQDEIAQLSRQLVKNQGKVSDAIKEIRIYERMLGQLDVVEDQEYASILRGKIAHLSSLIERAQGVSKTVDEQDQTGK